MPYLDKKTGYVSMERLLTVLADAGLGEDASDIEVHVGMYRAMVTWSEPRPVLMPVPIPPDPCPPCPPCDDKKEALKDPVPRPRKKRAPK